MTKKKRFEDLRNGKDPGYTLFSPILMHFAARYGGKTYGEFASDYRVLVETNLRALEDFDLDMVGLISDPYRETAAFGADIEFVPEEVPRCHSTLVRSMEDVMALKNPDVYREERTRDRIRGAAYYQKHLKGEVPVYGWIEGPLAQAADLTGVSELMMFLMTDPDICRALMDKCMVTAKDFARAQVEEGCDIIGIGDAVCSLVDAGMYNTYVKERHRELFDYIHEKGGLVKLHICGDINHLLEPLSDLDIDILDLDWQVEPEQALEIMGTGIIRCGNINPVHIQDGSPDEVTAACKELIDKERSRKYILSGGCEITVSTPPENLKAMRLASL